MARLRSPPAPAAALGLAAALLASGCRVEVDGAPCAVPGTSADCPGGQACGNDLRCSARALACAASRCAPGGVECTDAGAARRCESGPDPVCGRWVSAGCASRDPGCRIVADPRVLSGERGPAKPGVPDPPECRFGRLGDALDAAAARFPAAAAVEVDGEGAGTVTFGAATAEVWPLVVAANVALAGATPAGPAEIHGGAGVPGLLEVQGTAEDVRVDAEGATTAVRVTRAGARVVRVDVSGAAGAALQIEADPTSAATVEVLGGSYAGSGLGIWIRKGRVSVAPDPAHATTAVASANPGSTVVRGNARDGIVIGGLLGRGLPLSGAAVYGVLEGVTVEANGGTGVIFAGLPVASRLRVFRCDVRGNGAADPAPYGTQERNAGGVLVSLVPGPQLAFAGNRLWANARDQLAFESGDWSIAASGCGSESNVFACVAPGTTGGCDTDPACAVALTESGHVQASYSVWPSAPPYPYITQNNVTQSPYCLGTESSLPPMPACE